MGSGKRGTRLWQLQGPWSRVGAEQGGGRCTPPCPVSGVVVTTGLPGGLESSAPSPSQQQAPLQACGMAPIPGVACQWGGGPKWWEVLVFQEMMRLDFNISSPNIYTCWERWTSRTCHEGLTCQAQGLEGPEVAVMWLLRPLPTPLTVQGPGGERGLGAGSCSLQLLCPSGRPLARTQGLQKKAEPETNGVPRLPGYLITKKG